MRLTVGVRRGAGTGGGQRVLTSLVLLALALPSPLQIAGEAEEGKKAPEKAKERPDRVLLAKGAVVEGTLIDILPDKVIIKETGGIRSIERSAVKQIDRALSPEFLKFFAAQSEKSSTLADWRKLAAFSKRKGAHPEYRACLRQVLALAPDDKEARRELSPAGARPELASREEATEGEGKEGQDAPPEGVKLSSLEVEFVHDNIEKHLRPTRFQVLEDGRVSLLFNLSAKDRNHEESFTPVITEDLQSVFRWTRHRDERGDSGFGFGTKSSEPITIGVKVADQGTAFLNCWFVDDVEATIDYAPVATVSKGQYMALAFGDPKGEMVGNNLGTQCVTFKRGKLLSAAGGSGKLAFKETQRSRLIVRNGKFEACLADRKKQENPYDRSRLTGGRVGFAWGGGAAGIIMSFEVVGRIDYPKMTEELRHSLKS